MFNIVREQKRTCYKVLLIDHDVDQLDILLTGFEILQSRQDKDYDVSYIGYERTDVAWQKLLEESYDLIVLDSHTPGVSPLDFLAKIKKTFPKIEVIV
ncbi:hypothetical protein MJH12_13160, partial [bacterium]|nr:hypothetical protein [bacterium]